MLHHIYSRHIGCNTLVKITFFHPIIFYNILFCHHRFPHDDGTATSHLSAYSPSSSTQSHHSHYTLPKAYLSVGAESGVVSLFGADRDAHSGAYDFFNGTIDANRNVRSAPKQLKSLLNLTTQITSTVFHPSGQIAAIASNQVRTIAVISVFCSVQKFTLSCV